MQATVEWGGRAGGGVLTAVDRARRGEAVLGKPGKTVNSDQNVRLRTGVGRHRTPKI